MEFEGFFKKLGWFMVIFFGTFWYIRNYHDLSDAVKYAKEHPAQKVSPGLTYYAATAYYAREDYDHAIEAYTQLLEAYPTCQYVPSALFRLGDSYQERRNFEGARTAYTRYLEEFPDGKDKNTVEKKLEYVKFR